MTPSSAAKPSPRACEAAYSFALTRSSADHALEGMAYAKPGWPFRLESAELVVVGGTNTVTLARRIRSVNEVERRAPALIRQGPDGTRQRPPDEKHRHAHREQPRVRTERTGRKDIDEQDPHADELSEPTEIVEAPASSKSPSDAQIRSKFFSISRRVSRSITGRPCGQTLEYAVARSSSRMWIIFS